MINHKLTKLILIILSFCIVITIFVKNDWFKTIKIVDDNYEKENNIVINFSKESGFYDEPFYLEISSDKDVDIYYTLDSSDPTIKSIKYTNPIYLNNASLKENVYSMNKDVSTGFYEDIIETLGKPGSQPGYKSPNYLLDKCNVVRAIAIDKYGNKSTIQTNCYFVGLDTIKYSNAKIISIVTNPSNLFDYEKGIYVTGRTYDDALKNGIIGGISFEGKRWQFWPANYRNKGEKWERECYIEIFDLNNGNAVNEYENIGIRTQGYGSRGPVPRSLNLYTRKKYNSKNFNTIFDNYLPTKITLSAGGNELETKINDYLVTYCIKDKLDVTTMDFTPSILFIDGEYWGFYWMTTAYDETYFESYYQITKKNTLMIKNNKVEIGREEMLPLYTVFENFVISNDLEIQSNYEEALNFIDIDSYIDYYAMMIYISRQEDWPFTNVALWRSIEKEDSKYADGKFRWIVFDCNSVCMNRDVTYHNTLEFVKEYDDVFASMWKNKEFREKFESRIKEIADLCFDSKKVEDFINNYRGSLYESLKDSYSRFNGKDADFDSIYNDKLDSIIEFFDNRKAVVMSWFD